MKYFTGLLQEHVGPVSGGGGLGLQAQVSKSADTTRTAGLLAYPEQSQTVTQAVTQAVTQTATQAVTQTATQTVTQTIIRFNQASLSYRTIRKAEHKVLQGIDLAIAEGERIALVGNNGAGKSSLLKLIAGNAKPSAGSVAVLGQDTRSTQIEQLSRQVAFVFQNPEDMFIEDNVRKEIAYCLKRRKYPDADTRVLHMLRSFRLEQLQDRDARLLSGGQQRRVSLAIGAAVRPAVMLLDEPTANLDLATREELLSTLSELEQHVSTVIIATHDMQLVSRWATRVIVMHEGAVLADGTAADIFASPDLIRRAGLALTQSMELADALGLRPACSSPVELAGRLYQIIAGKGAYAHAARPQLV